MKALINVRIPLFLLFAILCISLVNPSDSDDPRIAKITKQTEKYKDQYQQQKVYLHTDKDNYQTGEIIWLKAYLTDEIWLQADTLSKEIFVELLDQSKRLAGKLILRNNKGFAAGFIRLQDTLLEGNYQLRAYTNWMSNFDRDFFFAKTIRIKNPVYENVITKARLKYISEFNNSVRKQENAYNVTFFPEGGNIVVGLANTIAFKAENDLGLPLDIKGSVVDDKGHVVSLESMHDGMGTFKLTPQTGKKYTAKITFPNGKVGEYSLPKALTSGIGMIVMPLGKEDIKVILCPHDIVSTSIIIVAQSRGQINYITKGEINDKPVMSSIPKKVLPAGITQITVFDSKGEPICERLVFIRPEEEKMTPQVELTSVTRNDSVICNIKVTPSAGNPLSGNVSLAVVEGLSNENSGNGNILTNLLLTSDIKGCVNNPGYYFESHNSQAANHLDLVMLTNGWRRFEWKDVLADKFPEITYSRMGGNSISGIVCGNTVDQKFPDNRVSLSIPAKFNMKFETVTDKMGRFDFPVLDYDDSVYVKIETTKTTDGKAGNILLNEVSLPGSVYPYPILYSEKYDKDKIKENTKRDNQERKQVPKIKTSTDDNEQITSYGTPGYTLKVGEDAGHYTNIIEYISGKIPGVDVKGSKITIRGVGTNSSSTDPLFILDDVTMDQNSISSIRPGSIEKIEVFKGPEASSFGNQGANGALVFYTKQARVPKRSSIELYLTGYHKTREFYSPPYESWKIKPENIGVSRTLYWTPDISFNTNGEAVVRFKKNPSAGKTTMTIEGLTNSGKIIYKRVQE